MITKPKARRFNLRPEFSAAVAAKAARRAATVISSAIEASQSARAAPSTDTANTPAGRTDSAAGRDTRLPTAQDAAALHAETPAEAELDAIRREGLTGRQLRLARRVAQKHNLPATSDFDAVRLLRKAGIDPFEKASLLDLVSGGGDDEGTTSNALMTIPADPKLPQTIKPALPPSVDVRAEQSHAADILKIQRDISRRRRKRSLMLLFRLSIFVFLPTLIAAWYYSVVASPLFATKTEFVIQQADAPGTSGMGGLLSGTQFATSQDSIAVQGYLQSREAMARLDRDVGFRQHFQGPGIDPIQRLPDTASTEDVYKAYQRNVKISYDPTEGIIKMEVAGPSPAVSEAWSRALIGYAEEQVDKLTSRLRADQMSGARDSYAEAEQRLIAANERVAALQERFKILSSEVEVTLITSQITTLETQLTQERLALAQMLSNASPNRSRVAPVERRIETLEREIGLLRSRLTETTGQGVSIVRVQSELQVAQTEVETRTMLLAQAAQQMETARMEANRQVRYLSLSVAPVAPDVPTYPRAFESTAVTFLILMGVYLVIAMTASILREQVSA
jgi:capsular polysaccharide transport system permease protein